MNKHAKKLVVLLLIVFFALPLAALVGCASDYVENDEKFSIMERIMGIAASLITIGGAVWGIVKLVKTKKDKHEVRLKDGRLSEDESVTTARESRSSSEDIPSIIHSKKFYKLKEKAEQGNARAMHTLACMYKNGDEKAGVTKDLYKSVEWFKRSAEHGFVAAQIALGNYYKDTDCVEDSLYWYTKAAEHNNAIAQFQLGYHYDKDKNYDKAFYWYTKSANQGLPSAQRNLARLYYAGWGVKQNKKYAMKLWKTAAKNGNEIAQCNLARKCRSKFLAVYWYKKSARQGYKNAQRELAEVYRNGDGVRKNERKAKYWQNKADDIKTKKTFGEAFYNFWLNARDFVGYIGTLYLFWGLLCWIMGYFVMAIVHDVWEFNISSLSGILAIIALTISFVSLPILLILIIHKRIQIRYRYSKAITIILCIVLLISLPLSSFNLATVVPGHKYSIEYIYESHNGTVRYIENGDGTLTAEIGNVQEEELIIPERVCGKAVTAIGTKDYFRAGDFNAKNVIIPDSVVSINNSTFRNCTSILSVTIGNSVISIGSSAFKNCIELKSITIPNSVTSIDSSAFENCYSLTSITIPNGVTSIDSGAFRGCNSVTSLTIGEGVKEMSVSVFNNCSNLTTVYWNATNIDDKWLGGTFDGCDKLTTVIFGENVSAIPASAFYNCSGLTNVSISNSVTSIGEFAFSGCSSLTNITIPSSVVSIDHFAFSECDKLTSVIFENTEGWTVTYLQNNTSKTLSALSNATTAAQYLSNTYVAYTWARS